ncbi:ABC transporter permease [Luteipulveratus mongoliensis]|uniref:ABC transporter permease n=1 Tax=Luteipulveratus mongoliensis TaxID=571913 RepID=A0A0K1JDW1_9MICO|nr:ABC transporter permease [Luteipulveratus mongoliensis]AKU14896.1 ABC transporter permease [Luteipulveratus mongoliensis]
MNPVRLTSGDLLRLGLQRVRTRPMRAVLSALGISIGIATMIMVIGVPASGQRALMTQLDSLGTNLLTVQPDLDPNDPVTLSEESIGMARRIAPVQSVSAVANTHATVRRSDRIDEDDTSGVAVLAAKTDLLTTLHGSMHAGSYLSSATEKFPTVVLGSTAATRLGITELRPHEAAPMVRINNRWFSVIGVLNTMPLAPDIDAAVLVGWDAARTELRFDGHPTVLYVRADERYLDDVRAVLPRTVLPDDPGRAMVSRASDALAAKKLTESAFSTLFLGLAGVALLVGGVGVANTMVISVLERKREIGLRRALGANRGQIRGQFLIESVVLCGLGGGAGILIGVLASAGYAATQGWPAEVPLGAVAGGFGAAIGVGILAGVYPAIRASRLTPTEALAAP